MAKKYSKIISTKRENANKNTRPKATIKKRIEVSTTKAAFVLDAIRGKDVETALEFYFTIQDMLHH